MQVFAATAKHPKVRSAPGLPNQLYREELVTSLVKLVKYHMQYNLLVLYDIKYRRMYRPSSLSLGEGDVVRLRPQGLGDHHQAASGGGRPAGLTSARPPAGMCCRPASMQRPASMLPTPHATHPHPGRWQQQGQGQEDAQAASAAGVELQVRCYRLVGRGLVLGVAWLYAVLRLACCPGAHFHFHHLSRLRRMSHALLSLQGRIEVLLVLLPRALAACRCEPELLLPLARVAMQTLPLEGGGEGLALLQLQAAGGFWAWTGTGITWLLGPSTTLAAA